MGTKFNPFDTAERQAGSWLAFIFSFYINRVAKVRNKSMI